MDKPQIKEKENLAAMLRAAVFGLERHRNSSVPYRQVAQEIGISQRTLEEWLRGKTPNAVGAVLKLICLTPDKTERTRLLEIWCGAPDGSYSSPRPTPNQEE